MTRIDHRIEPRPRSLAPVYDRLFEAYLGALPGDRPGPAAALGHGRMTLATRGALDLRDVSVVFPTRDEGPLEALGGVDLAVHGGEVIALIGPNGCGKSTLLRVIAGLLTPARGSVTLDGAPITGPDARVGLVFQEPRLLPWRTAADNITYPLELDGWPADRRAARLEELIDAGRARRFGGQRPASTLSGGTRQRVALARALALSPEVLLLDEPFSALDAMTRERFDLELLRLWERADTTIVHGHPQHPGGRPRRRSGASCMSPRPGRIVADIAVDLPRPTDAGADWMTAVATATMARQVRAHLEFAA